MELDLHNNVKENYGSWDYLVYTISQVRNNEDCDKFLSYFSYKDNYVPVFYDSYVYEKLHGERPISFQASSSPCMTKYMLGYSPASWAEYFGHNLKDDEHIYYLLVGNLHMP